MADYLLILPISFFIVYVVQLESLPTLVQGVWSDDPASQLEATTQFRKLLSIGAMVAPGVISITIVSPGIC